MSSANPSGSEKLCICCHEQYSGDIVSCPKDGTTLTELDRDNLVGTLFVDKYEMLDIIGGGGMGMVYRAKHSLMNRIVAIKVLHRQAATSSDALKRFQVESQAASALSMPNILTVYDFGLSSQGQPYMVMDYLDGQSLDDIINAEGRLPLHRAVDVFIQICNAMEHAHEKGILHRDIKPSNVVLVNFEGQPDFVKIVDFGIAKLLNPADPNSGNLTKTGEVFGSPMYMSPEQWKGGTLDCRTDIYSLGAVMYRCLSGQPMFNCPDVVQLMYNQVTELPESFASKGVLLPPEIERIVFKSLAKNPAERFQSMKELMQALRQFKASMSARIDAVESGDRSSIVQTERTRTLAAIAPEHGNQDTTSMPLNMVPSSVDSMTDAKVSKSIHSKQIALFSVLIVTLIAGSISTVSFLQSRSPQPQSTQNNTLPLSSGQKSEPAKIDNHVPSKDSDAIPSPAAPVNHQAPKRKTENRKLPSRAHKRTEPVKSHAYRGGIKNAIKHFLDRL